ncbi:metal-dependent hydrolase [Paenibacillus sp. FSL R5-0345]|uniref:amidohydrolase family protein n=1 Tax=Paenibacillus sp. FSL R5-0345 TaxID=1536770 RepID=UPI0004F7F412|nr:amidohydrolase family protein [Paenibacillus sp. FSL R5-0345]AIQ35502.1 metal-dependent hydrolase [Paenibacillus sp. FSL R5-0345]
MQKYRYWVAGILIILAGVFIIYFSKENEIKTVTVNENAAQTTEITEASTNEPSIIPDDDKVAITDLSAKYKELGLIDAHNHDASALKYLGMLRTWKDKGVQQVVMFGDVSEPSAILTDKFAWKAYQKYPNIIIPYFSGFDLHDPESLTVVRNNLEMGFFGLGEVVGASTMSPVVSKVAWKANDPMDGYLPQIYDIIAEYKAPILLHIDPPNGVAVAKLEQALEEHPKTIIIFGHINAYNTPEEIDRLLSKHPNLYADFFAGFSVYNVEGGNNPEQFIPVMKKFPDRFMLSTDSGYGIGSEKTAIDAMYQMLDLLDDPGLARKIAHDNLDAVIKAQPATDTQLELIRKLKQETGTIYHVENLSKAEAGQILAETN